ncbi:ABC-type multidrug transport system ATPase subunit [Nocardia sp. GAS34]
MRELRRRFGTTVLLTTHYMSEADELCDRVAMLHQGVLRAVGSPAELKAALGPSATLEDVFRHHTGAGLDEDTNLEGGLRNVQAPRGLARARALSSRIGSPACP